MSGTFDITKDQGRELAKIGLDIASDLRRQKGEGLFDVQLPNGDILRLDVIPENPGQGWIVRVKFPDGQELCEIVEPTKFLRELPRFLVLCTKKKVPHPVVDIN